MPIFSSANGNQKKDFTPAPRGTHRAVLVDVVDLGTEETQWGPKSFVRFIWEIDKVFPDTGRRFTCSEKYNNTLNAYKQGNSVKRSKLRLAIIDMLGRDIPDAEAKRFDLESLLGTPCEITIKHKQSEDGATTYANVIAIEVPNGEPLAPSGEYVRKIDRDRAKLNPAPASGFTGKPQNPGTGAGQSAGGHRGTQVPGPKGYDQKNPAGIQDDFSGLPVDEDGKPIF